MSVEQKDITEQFFECCKMCLEPGAIAHEKNFHLRYVMSAIDIMNPSMDAGMAKERRIVYLHDAIESGDLPLGCFSDLVVLLGVIDELIVLLVNWLTGDSLVQTVYTCMYMHCIPLIEDSRLALFCEALRRIILSFRRLLLTLPSFEDEDFCPTTNGVPLMIDTKFSFPDHNPVNSYYEISNENLIELLQEERKKLSERKSEPSKVVDALTIRLRLAISMLELGQKFAPFLSVLGENNLEESFNNVDISDYGDPVTFGESPSQRRVTISAELFDSVCQRIEEISTEIIGISKLLVESANCGKDAGPGKDNPRSEKFSIPGFEPYLTLANLTATVQRFPRSLSRSSVFFFLECAFSRIVKVLQELRSLIAKNSINAVLLHELCSLAHAIGHNLCHSLFNKAEALDSLKVENACLKSCVLSRGILGILMGVILKCPLNANERFSKALDLSPPGMHFVVSWMSVECDWTRDYMLDNIEYLAPYASFFEHVFMQIYSICRCYTLNRSRQRSNMERIFGILNELLDDAVSVETTFALELVEARIAPRNSPIPIHLTSYICFFYYHLVWDYLVTGFQLDLYSTYEWVYVYALIITLQRNLSVFLDHIMKELMVENSGQSNTSAAFASVKKRRRRRGGRGDGGSTAGSFKETEVKTPLSPSISSLIQMPSVSADYWNFQVAHSNIHRFLSVATLYAMRALQRDAGINLKAMNRPPRCSALGSSLESHRKFYSSLKSQFIHRMGPVISSRFSPLVDNEGPEGFFQTTHSYVTSKTFVESEIKDLYKMAAKVYEIARQWIAAAKTLNPSTSYIGPVDPLDRLDHLANNNKVFCDILVSRPEKRPKHSESEDCSRKNCFHPVHLNYDYLSSRVYPLLRFV
ncbi:n alpha acetyltransferase 35 natc auxiliary [Echinococcus multilocularis]|uniref:Protein MAK10 homolog n=1 Tax=Echinococcus multilocularis TaxID=6211 RepID=A0A087VYY2_ECHMU|nr:n alpha acetyltransferase 35 natc auxiliary [Echinococcus multilocularis]